LTVKKINLALQGGGAHGAFTWGVLDQMLQDPWIEIAALSGTSAGALNAAAMKVPARSWSGCGPQLQARTVTAWNSGSHLMVRLV
jgi:NTE family protein